jgi:hypothetical protein
MKKILGSMLVALCATGLVACGDKAEDAGGSGGGARPPHGGATASGPVGTWELDVAATWDTNKAKLLEQANEGFAQMEQGMQALAGLSEEEKAGMKEMIMGQVPAEHRDLVEAYLRSPAEAKALLEKKARAQMDTVRATVEIKADKTYVGLFTMGTERKEESTGTWSVAGDQVTFTPKTKDGKPVEGDDAKTKTGTLKGDTLSAKDEADGPTMILKRRK